MGTVLSPVFAHGWDDQWRESWRSANPARWPEIVHHHYASGGNADWSSSSVLCGRCGVTFLYSEDCFEDDEYTSLEQTIFAHKLGLCHVVDVVGRAMTATFIASLQVIADEGDEPF